MSIEAPTARPAVSPLITSEMTTPEAIALALEDAGVDLVMGLCAGFTTPVFEALYGRPGIRTIQVRQELLGSLAANAYGRLTGRPAVISGEGEFILGTASQGILESRLGSTPMVIVTEMYDGVRMAHHGQYHSGAGEYGSYDAVSAFKAICKEVFVSSHPEQAVQDIQLAVKHSMAGEPGPVCVILRGSAFEGYVRPDSFPRIYKSEGYIKPLPKTVDLNAVAAAAADLRSAAKPVIIAGNGVRLGKAYDELAALARELDAPVVTTQGGKGVYDEFDDLAGQVFGEWGHESANALVAGADLLVIVGSKMGPIDTVDQIPTLIDPSRQKLVQIDIEARNAAWTLPVDHLLVGDAGATMAAMVEQLKAAPIERAHTAAEWIKSAVAEHDLPDPNRSSDAFPLHPQKLVDLIQEAWPKDGVVCTDAGESRTYMLNWFKSSGEGRYLVPHGGGGMGYAIGAAFGSKLAEPRRPVLAVCGDGGFPMTMNTLMNGLQEGTPFAVVIFNNRALGWPLHTMRPENQKFFEFHDFDHAAISKAMSCEGKRCESVADVRAALAEALESKVPYVIDVPIALEDDFRISTSNIAKAPRTKPWQPVGF